MGLFQKLIMKAKVKNITDSVYSRDFNLDDSDIAISSTVFINQNLCISCGKCKDVCPIDAIQYNENKYYIDNNQCVECLYCITACPMEAIISD